MRIKDPTLLETYKYERCSVLNCTSGMAVTGHHIKSVGSGGHDIEDNLLPLCMLHHNEIHTCGLKRFVERYREIRSNLESKNWYFDEFNKKWRTSFK